MATAFRPVAMLLAIAAAGVAQTSDLHGFITQLQRASHSGDRQAIAAMLHYPITITIGGLRVPIADAQTFLNRYDDIFNPVLRDQIARASVSEGRIIGAHDIAICDAEGVMQITGITVPMYGGAPPTAGSASGERNSEPRRVAIRVGPRPTQIPGLLISNDVDVFLVFIPKGKLAGVRLERAAVGSAAIRVIHA